MEEKKQKNELESSIKITITKEAGDILVAILGKANEGFEAGRITRQDFASFIIEKFNASFTEKDLMQLRQKHYDDESMFDAIHRKMRETGEIPDFIREALRKQFQGNDEPTKKNKKSLKDNINDVVSEKEDAA
jgi:hypothetical protein